ncbi:ABC transporter substrate-binding protein [Paenibacillus sp. UNC451MF]|uniref:ABC transporter substrate-binding protein n=1 Tax=Paenibacillus sp. UNC451MF TaxID=1449063 RepID=UPI0018CC7979|nr:extracellular solute-binding protein [Paenibacillus sp. UNC451MF]
MKQLMFMKRSKIHLLVFPFLLLLAAGCSNGGGEMTSADKVDDGKPKAPVTLKVLFSNPGMTDEIFQQLIAEPVKQLYPHISFETIKFQPDFGLNELISAGEIPDLIYATPYIQSMLDSDIPLDLTEQLKKHNIDTSRFNPTIMDAIKSFGTKGEIYSLPYMSQSFALWYNKSIFDRFGVPYPKDGMTWDEAIELSKKLARVENGVQYRGMVATHGGIATFASSLSIELVDPKTSNALVSDHWNAVFAKGKALYDVVENRPLKLNASNVQLFVKDKTLAMAPYWTGGMIGNLALVKDLDWDVVQAPSFTEAPDKYYQVDYHQFVVSKTTKHIDDVMDVLKVIVSDEVQAKAARMGKETVLTNQSIIDQFAQDLDFVKGKNLKGIFKSQPSNMIYQSKYNGAVSGAINAAFNDVFEGKSDINSALRKAKEEADKKVAELKVQ